MNKQSMDEIDPDVRDYKITRHVVMKGFTEANKSTMKGTLYDVVDKCFDSATRMLTVEADDVCHMVALKFNGELYVHPIHDYIHHDTGYVKIRIMDTSLEGKEILKRWDKEVMRRLKAQTRRGKYAWHA